MSRRLADRRAMAPLQAKARPVSRRFHSLTPVAAFAAALALAAVGQAKAPGSAALPGAAVEWLKKALAAPDRLSYRALETLVTQDRKSTHTQRVRLVHRAPCSSRRDYLSEGRDPQLVVADDGRSHWQYFPRERKIIFSPSLPADRALWQERHLGRLLSNYVVRGLGPSTMEGRQVHSLEITPRGGHDGPTKRLWVDDKTGLILSSELATSDGGARLTSRLSGLRLEGAVPRSEFAAPAARREHVLYEQSAVLPVRNLARQWKHPLMVPTRMASGYGLESARLVRRGKYTFIHLRYFDGLNALSLFEDFSPASRGAASAAREGERVHRAAVSWKSYPMFRSLSWREDGLKLTLVGDLPRGELLRIARSVSRLAR